MATAFSVLILLAATHSSPFRPPVEVAVRSSTVDASRGNSLYVGNRVPLLPSVFRKLPVGSIIPKGWIRKQLQLEADGFTGHLTEISPWLAKKNNAWLSKDGIGEHGWEEVPYWLKGFGDLGYVLGDARIRKESQIWIEGILGSQQPDGWIGPKSNRTASDGKPDMWPNMVAVNCLQTYFEATGDKRVIDVLSKYFKYQLALPETSMYLSYWEKHRGGDNLESVYWLYNRTGQPWLLDLARKIHARSAAWVDGVPDRHGVNYAQAFREPAEYWLLTRDPAHLAATQKDYDLYYSQFGQVPGGMYGADENARTGFGDPRQAAETCAMVEMMHSDEMLLKMTGNPVWAERCEDVAFNSLPASMTANEKALHYLTSPNMIQCDAGSKAPGLQNSGPMLLFDPYDHRCCQHNVSHGWPYYSEHLWLAAPGNGLAVALYGPSQVTARVGGGQTVTIDEETQYPFRDQVRLKLRTAKPVAFPLTLRLPAWCSAPVLSVNNRPVRFVGSGGYATLNRTWRNGDTVSLQFPMQVRLRKWAKNHDSVSVQRGPLTYSLAIAERYQRKGGTSKWPSYEAYAASKWNYGLDVSSDIQVENRPWPKDDQPFTQASAPVALVAKGYEIPQWSKDYLGLVGLLQQSPAKVSTPKTTLKLVPMGAARLRIAAFPTASTKAGTDWVERQKPKKALPALASWVFPADTVAALTDGLLPTDSGDLSIPRFTWWDHKGTSEWVQIELPAAIQATQAQVYWFNDASTDGGCRPPAEWSLLAEVGGQWVPVEATSPYEIKSDRFSSVSFAAITARRFRVQVQLQDGFSAGILEMSVR